MKLTATKSMRYASTALEPGDHFEAATARDGRVLKAIGKAVDRDEVKAELQQRAGALGIKVDQRWGEERLSDEIAKADAPGDPKKGKYQRRDMRAED